ncbi:MAG: acyltransferase family protein [Sphingomonas bacterium]
MQTSHAGPYRPDIDGLRTLAVLPVIMFHLGMSSVPGGFVGVDVFFVISGFLISGGIQRDIAEGRFKLLDFYERRARRILPALFIMMAFTLVVGWFLFLPDDYRHIGDSVAATCVFASNFLFWMQADYFNGPVDLKPLVHTWSLAVEEQFYIILPLFLWVVARKLGGRFLGATLAIAFVSFLISIVMVRLAPSAAFYLLPSRGWELLIGALLSQKGFPAVRRSATAEAVAATGLAMVVGSALFLSSSSSFPGANALFPCVGAALIIHAGSGAPGTAVARLLGWGVVRWIGLISYSLYLWHWPLIVFTKYELMVSELPPVVEVGVAAVTFLAAWLSWRFVERPFRSKRVSRRGIFVASLSAIGVFFVAGAVLFIGDGAAFRFAGKPIPEIARADHPLPGEAHCFLEAGFESWGGANCYLSRKDGATTLIWSDSHGYQYRNAIRDLIGPKVTGNILLYSSAGCLPLFDVTISRRPHCRSNNDYMRKLVKAYHVDRVVLVGHWEANLAASGLDLDDVARTIKSLRDLGLDVWLIGDNPEYAFNNMPLLAQRLAERQANRPFLMTPKFSSSWNDRARIIIGSDRFSDPMASLCPNGKQCLVYDHGQSLMSESNHLSFHGARVVAQRFLPIFERPQPRASGAN